MKFSLKGNTKLIIGASSMISMFLILFIAVIANLYIKRMSENNTALYDAYRISELMKSFRSNIVVLENKQRGYTITGDAKFLEAYKEKETETKTYLKSMEKYFVGKPEEVLFVQLKEHTYRMLMEEKDLSRTQGMGMPQVSRSEEGLELNTLNEINDLIDAINQSLSKTTEVLINNSIEYVQASRIGGILEVALGILVAVSAVIILFRDVNIRNKLESELRIAKRQADENAVMKEQFMANMSHEIRTPMNAILGFSDLLQKTNLNETQSTYLSAIKNSGSNLLNIINDILDFSKIEAGKLNIEKIPFSITSLLDSLRIMFGEKATEKKIGFQIEIDNQIPSSILGDPTRLTQILVNLINNAIKFTHKGSVNVSCKLESLANETANIEFRVKDTGIGIPKDKQDEVFGRFNQGNAETTRKYGGTGLGLSIVKNLVELQEGEITFTSVENEGTEFVFTLNYAVSEEMASENHHHSTSTSLKFDKPYRVLLAEDNEMNQRLATTIMKEFGLDIHVAENGLIAIEKLKAEPFDLVLMDVQMPVLDGYTASSKIREELQLDLPIIAMTAHIMAGEKEKCISYGMTDYISKPFKEVELYNVLNTYLLKSKKQSKIFVPKPTQTTTTEAVSTKVQLDDLYALTKGNKPFIKEMIELFLRDVPADIEKMEEAFTAHDYDTIKLIAHKMRTSVGFMGLKDVLASLRKIENAENTEIMDVFPTEFAIVKEDCAVAVVELNQILNTL